MNDKAKLPTEMVALAGEYHVLAQLAERNIRGSLTVGKAKGVDIFAHNPTTDTLFKVEVKTTSAAPKVEHLFGEAKCHVWMMSQAQENAVEAKLIYCFVCLNGPGIAPKVFVVPASEVGPYLASQHATYNAARGKTAPFDDPNTMRKFRIPEDDPHAYSTEGWKAFGTTDGSPTRG